MKQQVKDLLKAVVKWAEGKPEWINEFGDAKSIKVEDWGQVTSLRVFCQEDLEVEYGITTLEWAREPLDEGTRQVIADGMEVMLDKSGILEQALIIVGGKGSSFE
jgi:hypothetical protein